MSNVKTIITKAREKFQQAEIVFSQSVISPTAEQGLITRINCFNREVQRICNQYKCSYITHSKICTTVDMFDDDFHISKNATKLFVYNLLNGSLRTIGSVVRPDRFERRPERFERKPENLERRPESFERRPEQFHFGRRPDQFQFGRRPGSSERRPEQFGRRPESFESIPERRPDRFERRPDNYNSDENVRKNGDSNTMILNLLKQLISN